MSYVRVESSVRTNRKFLQAGPAASWLWLCGIAYCQDTLTDGFIPGEALQYLGVERPHKLIAKLVAARLWDEEDGGWRIHDYLEHNKPASEINRIKRERATGGQKGGRPPNKNLQGKPSDSQKVSHPENPSTSTSTSTATSTTTSTAPSARARGNSLVVPPKHFANVAHFSPLGDVPHQLHSEFVRKVGNGGVSEDEADRQVRAFYAVVERAYDGQVIGEEPWKFWRAEFAARAGHGLSKTTAAILRGGEEFVRGA